MKMNWISAEDEILIKFVREHEILYNIKLKPYRQTEMKQKLWCDVAEILKKTDTDCHKRWCYIRDYYIRRKGKNTSGESAKRRSDLLSFLDNIPSPRKNSTNVIKVEIPAENLQDCSEPPFKKQKSEDTTFDNEEETFSTDDITENSKDSENYEYINKTFKDERPERDNNSHAKERLCPQNDLDETDLFFSSMARIVKKLPRYEQAQIRMQIGSLVGNAELRHISSDAPPDTKAWHKK